MSALLIPGLRKAAVTGCCRRALWDVPRKKTTDEDIVRVTGQLELTPSPKGSVLTSPPLRSQKYNPPPDLEHCLEASVRKVFGDNINWKQVKLDDHLQKFHLLHGLASELGHVVPNNRLHEMQTTRDVLTFYSTPVKDTSKFDELIAADLPSNLKITWGY